jgi:hypothetical protein
MAGALLLADLHPVLQLAAEDLAVAQHAQRQLFI